jgi:two-component system osmolarity sensor histidine kinase EnvZ
LFTHTLSQVDLFTRSFLLLSTLMLASLGAWVLIFFSLEMGPRAAQMSQRIATSVTLTLSTLSYTPKEERLTLLRTLSLREGLDVSARRGLDVIEPLPAGRYWQRIEDWRGGGQRRTSNLDIGCVANAFLQ